jgi:RHS repeat-associated protein
MLSDRTPASGIPNTPLGTDALDRRFSYDPLYRLLSATGRECDTPSPNPPWDDRFPCRDVNLTRPYTETYTYDRAGNLSALGHQSGAGGFNREIALSANTNQLDTVTIGADVFSYAYDPSGNLIGETSSRHCEWDHSNRMRVYRTQTAAAGVPPGDPQLAEPTVYAHYLYDSKGQRVKKLIRRQGGQFETAVYIEGIFELLRRDMQSNNLVHVMDSRNKVATVRAGPSFADDHTPAIKYQLGDHLGSSNVVVDDAGAIVDREEYTPYGETSFGSFATKRYRFQGKERDEESGLNFHGARYYAAWLARWVSCDPVGAVDGPNLYTGFRNNPMNRTDPRGTQTRTSTTAVSLQERPELQAERHPEVGSIVSLILPSFRFTLAEAGLFRPLNEEIVFRPGLTNREVYENGVARQQRNLVASVNRVGETLQYGAQVLSEVQDLLSVGAQGIAQAQVAKSLNTPLIRSVAAGISVETAVESSAIESASSRIVQLNERFASIVESENLRLGADLSLIEKYQPGLYKAITSGRVGADRIQGLAAAAYGNTLERMVAEAVKADPLLAPYLEYLNEAGASRVFREGFRGTPDWAGKGPLEGLIFDLTTSEGVEAHLERWYGENLVCHTYERPESVPF